MALINCSECGNQVNENDSVCSNCGNQLNQNMFNTNTTNIFNQPQEETTTQKLLCSECGNQVNKNDSVCSNCGNPLSILKTTETNEITKNIETIKKTANVVDILLKVVAVIFFVVGVLCLFGWDDEVIVIAIFCGIIGAILLVVSNFIGAFIKWKAYMLETNYGILKNMECERKWH